ncbi:MAG: hypothetical protein SGCHY_005234 [Lobulomycetales sp.]
MYNGLSKFTNTKRKFMHPALLPFLMAFVACCLWLKYAEVGPGDMSIIIKCNGTGLLVSVYCIFQFIKYSRGPEKIKAERNSLVALAITCVILAKVKFAEKTATNEHILSWFGPLCSAITMVMLGSPLFSLKRVFRTRRTDSLSFPLAVMSTVYQLPNRIFLLDKSPIDSA